MRGERDDGDLAGLGIALEPARSFPVLYVEDNDDNVFMLKMRLEACSITDSTILNGMLTH
jgi:hypothetical protein